MSARLGAVGALLVLGCDGALPAQPLGDAGGSVQDAATPRACEPERGSLRVVFEILSDVQKNKLGPQYVADYERMKKQLEEA